MTTLQVKLDTSATPPVTVIPAPPTNINRGNQTITWTRFANQTFTFKSLAFTTQLNPFTVALGDTQVTATENNQATGDYSYVIVVTLANRDYSSGTQSVGDQSTEENGIIAGNGTAPVIHNN
jgi:hypothetical protein